jgi:hypothetical protein
MGGRRNQKYIAGFLVDKLKWTVVRVHSSLVLRSSEQSAETKGGGDSLRRVPSPNCRRTTLVD